MDYELLNISENLANYIADYIAEETSRNNPINSDTIKNAIEAYNGGAR